MRSIPEEAMFPHKTLKFLGLLIPVILFTGCQPKVYLMPPPMDLQDISGPKDIHAGGAHDSWYNHPWVSNDVSALLLFNASPLERGLAEYWHDDGSRSYRFPPDYPARFRAIADEKNDEFLKTLQSGAGQ
ncbi:MAG: hypothetical protein WBW79_03065 [Desulfocapsaceae bacterium]